MTDIDHAGFADPVLDAQRSFRALLDAMARPGTIHQLDAPADAPPPLARATAAVLLALPDADTPLWLEPRFAPCLDWLTFHTGAHGTDNIADAAFALASVLPDLGQLNAGDDAAPEASTTLILQVDALGTDAARQWRLAGPGIAAPRTIGIAGLPPDFAARWAANHALFPRGVDLIVCAGDRLLAVPRTTQISEP